jgi:nucleoid-associated protein YgaU
VLQARVALASAGPEGHPFDEVLVWLCEVVLLLAGGWLWVVTGLVARDAARGRDPARRGVPVSLRRLLLAACGAALVGGLAAPAYAAPVDDARVGAGTDGPTVAGLPAPDRVTVTTYVSQLVARPPDPAPARTVVVRPGDTLWALAAESLPPDAPDAAVTARWQQIYRANRAVIGADPDLIQPDQRLRLPRR